MYSYNEVLNFDKSKNLVIEQLSRRWEELYQLILDYEERNELINSSKLQREIMEIERRFKI